MISRWKLLLYWIALTASPVWAEECHVTVNSIRFDMYDVNSASPSNATGSIQVICSSQTTLTITLDAGMHAGGNFSQRSMASGSDNLLYNLFLDAAATQIWGDGTQGTSVYTGLSNTVISVYARIPSRQNVIPGEYQDSIVFTVIW